jgi:hypothetical protein
MYSVSSVSTHIVFIQTCEVYTVFIANEIVFEILENFFFYFQHLHVAYVHMDQSSKICPSKLFRNFTDIIDIVIS